MLIDVRTVAKSILSWILYESKYLEYHANAIFQTKLADYIKAKAKRNKRRANKIDPSVWNHINVWNKNNKK